MRLLRNYFLRDSFSRCPRRRSCPVVSPAFFSAPACRPSSQRYPHRTGIQFSSYTREGGMFLLIEFSVAKWRAFSRMILKSFTGMRFFSGNPSVYPDLRSKMTCVISGYQKLFWRSFLASSSTYPDLYRQNITLFLPSEQNFFLSSYLSRFFGGKWHVFQQNVHKMFTIEMQNWNSSTYPGFTRQNTTIFRPPAPTFFRALYLYRFGGEMCSFLNNNGNVLLEDLFRFLDSCPIFVFWPKASFIPLHLVG